MKLNGIFSENSKPFNQLQFGEIFRRYTRHTQTHPRKSTQTTHLRPYVVKKITRNILSKMTEKLEIIFSSSISMLALNPLSPIHRYLHSHYICSRFLPSPQNIHQ